MNFFFWEFVFQCCQSVIHQPTVSLEVCVAMEGVSGMCLSAVLKESMAEDFEYLGSQIGAGFIDFILYFFH